MNNINIITEALFDAREVFGIKINANFMFMFCHEKSISIDNRLKSFESEVKFRFWGRRVTNQNYREQLRAD